MNQRFTKNIACRYIRHQKQIDLAGNLRRQILVGCRGRAKRYVHRNRPLDNGFRQFTATAHFCQRLCIDRHRHFRVDHFIGGQNRHVGFGNPQRMQGQQSVDQDFFFLGQIRGDIHSAVGMISQLIAARFFERGKVAEQTPCPEPAFTIEHSPQKVAAVDQPFDQDARLRLTYNRHGCQGRLGRLRFMHDFCVARKTNDRQQRRNQRTVADQHGFGQPGVMRGFHGSQRFFILRRRHNQPYRSVSFGAFYNFRKMTQHRSSPPLMNSCGRFLHPAGPAGPRPPEIPVPLRQARLSPEL